MLAEVGVERSRTALAAGGFRRSEVRTSFDGYGLPVQVDDLEDTATASDDLCTRTTYAQNTASGPQYVTTSTAAYDVHGRVLTSSDALGRATSTAYTPATGGPMTGMSTTSPDPDGSGSLTAHVTTTSWMGGVGCR